MSKTKSVIKSKTKILPKNNTDFEDKIEYITEQLRENYLQQKKLMSDMKQLMLLHKKDLKSLNKLNKTNCGKNSGFNKPQPVPESLRLLLKLDTEPISRSAVTKLLYQYFTDNKMYNTKTKKEIIPTPKIKKIFGMVDGDIINFFNLQTWLKKIYTRESKKDLTLDLDD